MTERDDLWAAIELAASRADFWDVVRRAVEREAAPEISREVAFSMTDPDMVCHLQRDDCGHEQPHHISECGAFHAAPEISDAVVERAAKSMPAKARGDQTCMRRTVS